MDDVHNKITILFIASSITSKLISNVSKTFSNFLFLSPKINQF